MKHMYRTGTIGFMIMMIVAMSTEMRAAGTPAGTVITTMAKANYTSRLGGAASTVFSNPVSVTVAQVASVNITTPVLSKTTDGDGVFVDYPIEITNSGNGSDAFTLTSASTKGFARTFYADANGNNVLDAGEDGAPITATPSLAADASYKVIMRVTVPANSALNGQVDVSTATATSTFNASRTAQFSGTTTINTAVFLTGSSLSVVPTNVSAGGNVTYTFTITNTGSITATGVSLSDVIQAPYTYVSGTGPGFTAPVGGGPATWNIGDVAAGATVTVTLTLAVPGGTATGTVLHNTFSATYSTPGPVTHTVNSNDPFVAVGATGGVTISLPSYAYEVEMEDGITIPLTVKNIGNITSVFEMTANSAHGYVWTFYNDVNGNGTYEPATDVALTNTNAVGGVDVGVLAPGATVKLVATVTIPTTVTVDQMVDNSTLTVTSAIDASVFQSSTVALTVNIPSIQLVRTVSEAGREPGQTSTYTTTYRNIGHGKAYGVVIIDGEPDHTTYIPNSTMLNGVAKTDAEGDDEVSVTTSGGKKVITVTIGTLNGQSPVTPGSISFRCTVN